MSRQRTQEHFNRIARHYRALRNTDEEPVLYIRALLPPHPLTGVDVGAGTGRYTERLHRLLPEGSILTAAELNAAMLAGLVRNTAPLGIRAVRSRSEALPFAPSSADLVTTFNAVHHFNLERFADEVAGILRPGGHLFAYTRTPEQNAISIWGQHFPDFVERETRLHRAETLTRVLGAVGAVRTTTFRYPRRATRARLVEQVRGRHYSTFSLYADHELEEALSRFLVRLDGADEIGWEDQNLLVQVRAAAS